MTSMYALRPHPVEFNKFWININETLNKILSLQPIDRQTWSFSFSDIYFLCVAVPESQCTRLYNAVKECIQVHVKSVHQHLLSMPDESLVLEYHKMWLVFDKGVEYIQSLFSYMNNQLMRERRTAESQLLYADPSETFIYKEIGMLAFEIWKDNLIVKIKDRLVRLLLDEIELDRRNVDIRVVDTRDVILSFVAVTDRYSYANEILQGIPITAERTRPIIKFYEEVFEAPFLEKTKDYFQNLSTVKFADLDCSHYMKKIIQIKEEELSRASRFLYFTSREKVERLSSEILVEAQKERLDTVCRQLIEHESLEDLRNMHACLKPVPNGFAVLLNELSHFIKTTGVSMVVNANANNDPTDFVSSLYNCQSRFSRIVKEVFNNESEFITALDKAMEFVVNYRAEERQISKASERVNRFIDSILRKSKINWGESEMESKLNMALIIFRYIEDKDVFEKYYSKLFATRLIMNNSASKEMEEQMIKKMKEACGFEFTNKLSRMFTDIGISEELTKDFNEQVGETKMVQSSFLILQSAAWPISSDPNIEQFTLPNELEIPMLKFDEFYREKHHGRKLTWITHLANAEVRLNYLDRAYIVTMSAEQYALLLNFENQDRSTVGELASRYGNSIPMVGKALRGLIDGNVLNCTEQTDLDENSLISLNLTLSNKRLRFKITAPLAQKSVKETQRVIDTVQQDRKLCIECVIVRIMKARKVMKHGELVNEVINQTKSRFTPDISTIKQCISQLIEKLYMQRTDDYEEYQYLA